MHQGITGVVGTGPQFPWAWGSACSSPVSRATHRNAELLLPVPDLSCSLPLAKDELGWASSGEQPLEHPSPGQLLLLALFSSELPKTACYNIRCSLSADHYTRSKSISCPKTELTRSKLILKSINPKTDLRHLSWELALWQLLKTYYTNLISNKQQHSRSLGFSGHLEVYHLTSHLHFRLHPEYPLPDFTFPPGLGFLHLRTRAELAST